MENLFLESVCSNSAVLSDDDQNEVKTSFSVASFILEYYQGEVFFIQARLAWCVKIT